MNARVAIVSWAIKYSIPVLNLVRRPTPWPSLDELDGYPPGTLGREVADAMRAAGLPFLPSYENHDAIHVILDYPTTPRGELELQAFMWGNRSSSFAGRVLFVWGALMLPGHVNAMRLAYWRGRRAKPIHEARLPFQLHRPLAALREEWETPLEAS